MKSLIFLLVFLTSNMCQAQCTKDIENAYNNLSSGEFITYCENLPDSCKSSYVNYHKSLAYFVLGSPYLAKLETEKIIWNSMNGNEHFIDVRLGLLGYLQMEEYRRHRNKEQFEKWKNISQNYMGKGGCTTGGVQYIRIVYGLMIKRFELCGDKKSERKYRRKIRRSYAGVFAPKFYKY